MKSLSGDFKTLGLLLSRNDGDLRGRHAQFDPLRNRCSSATWRRFFHALSALKSVYPRHSNKHFLQKLLITNYPIILPIKPPQWFHVSLPTLNFAAIGPVTNVAQRSTCRVPGRTQNRSQKNDKVKCPLPVVLRTPNGLWVNIQQDAGHRTAAQNAW